MDSDHSARGLEHRPHDRHHISDGNLVIISGGVEFKVYRGLLARNSTVFADIFALPTPTDQEVDGDDIPIIHLQEDPPQDLEVLFDLIYQLPPVSPLALDQFARVLRLADKYDMTSVKEWSKRELYKMYPISSDFTSWLARSPFLTKETAPVVFALSRRYGFDELAAPAFYAIISSDWDKKYKGDPMFQQPAYIHSRLIESDTNLAFYARQVLTQEASDLLYFLPQFGVVSDGSTTCCQVILSSKRGRQLADFIRDPLGSLIAANQSDNLARLCAKCHKLTSLKYSEESEKLYDRLHVILGVPGPVNA